MDNQDYLPLLIKTFNEQRHPENAMLMEKYLKGHFPFIGIRTPARRDLSKQFIKNFDFQAQDALPIIQKLWQMTEREFQYVAADTLVRNKKLLRENHIDLLEYLITTKSWWDTVDTIASHLVGIIFSKYPHLVSERGIKWLQSENIWLQRSMILFQLKYKERTDEELLFSIIERTAWKKEFFIQKAIGWSLREYSKTNSEAVVQFIKTHELSNLAKREGLKHIQR